MLNPDEKQKAHNNEKVEILINEERSWETFANDQFREDKIKGNYFATVSLESFHNGIHLLLGTGRNLRNQSHLPPELQSGFQGHMGHPSFAAVSISGLRPDVTDIGTVRSHLLSAPQVRSSQLKRR